MLASGDVNSFSELEHGLVELVDLHMNNGDFP